MKKRLITAMVGLAALTLSFAPAHADADPCSITGGSASTPQISDPSDDATLGGSGVDQVRDSDTTDLRAVWFEKDDAGTYKVHIQTTMLTGAESNQQFYVLWDFQGSDDAKLTRRFISAQPRPTVPGVYTGSFDYGYLDSTTPGVATYTTQGDTTGSATAGSPGEIVVTVPLDKMGNPGSGDTLANLAADSTLLIGPPGHGHPEIAHQGSGGAGLVRTVDDATNADSCADVTIP